MLNRIEAGRIIESTEKIDFRTPVKQGQLVELVSRVVATGRTSLTVEVEVHGEDLLSGERVLSTRGRIVLVTLDAERKPTRVPTLSASIARGEVA